MNILQLCIRVPYPPVDGGSFAMYQMQKSLHENGARLKVLSFNTIKQLIDIDSLDQDYREMTRIEGVYLDNRIKPFAALFNIFTGESYHIVRFIRRDFEEKLIRILKEENFDIIQLESLYMIPYMDIIRKFSSAKIVLRTHNIEHLIWKRLSIAASNPLRKWYLNLLSERLRHYENWAINKVDAIISMTTEDEKLFKEMGAEPPVFIAPVGFDTRQIFNFPEPDHMKVFHLGSMDWLPNQEGLNWFLKSIWPIIISKVPEAKLSLAGKKMPDSIKAKANEKIIVQDFVPDSRAFMAVGGVMIVPLLSGSGMRVKIIEGMSLGKAIVTTSVGMEGIPGKNGSEFLIADTPEEFADRVVLLLSQPGLQEELGRKAREFVVNNFDSRLIGKSLIQFYETLISDK